MKVQCDVCAAEAASVFCCADEAALCDACDRRVHRANKLAGKHRRFSLVNPSASGRSPPAPLCDICQEKRGFLFCKEDRAILCRECDAPVHSTSELTMRHSRYLLTGVRLSSEPAASPAPPSEEENSSSFCCSADDAVQAPAPATSHGGSSGSSSISEYLTKTLPGWHVEDFLVDDATAEAAAATSSGISANGPCQGVNRIGGLQESAAYPAWMAQQQPCCDSLVAGDAVAIRERWVPQMYTDQLAAGSKRSRTSTSSYYR
ncbi:B-box zinc finger protein 20-like [Oryza brachyantha]|uniref:B-box zinc finger protein 20-like n=1 Tax=Oryza brachyantha TaxID=4533 RepID=UPI001ADBA9ED|nr:B-box zinc finger protein 20-like [Oryza brachyantha]